MEKIKSTKDTVLRKRKRIKVGKRGKHKVIAVEWVDIELIDNINLRSKLSRWRMARKQKEPKEVLKIYEEEYKEQQRKTS